MSNQTDTAARAIDQPQAVKAYALPHERAEYDDLLAEANALDAKRQCITGRLNVLRQRFMQRRLAASRGKPFRRTFEKEASANAD